MDSWLVFVKDTKVLDDMQITDTRLIGGGACMKLFKTKKKICALTSEKTNMHLVPALEKLCSCKDSKLLSS
jgi:hypothetical protein